jgi:hypothetical protein
VPNETIDDAVNLDFMALALLTVLLRHQDGWEITLAEIGERYGYGRDALARAMGLLQVARYVVKIRIMSVGDNLWATDVVVFDTPASEEEVAALLDATARDPGVRAVQLIEPTRAAVELARKRREKLGPTRRQRPSACVPARPEVGSGAGQAPTGPSSTPPEAAPEEGPAGAGASGGAAAGTGPQRKTPERKAPGQRLTRRQAAAVRAVEEAWPEQLRELLPKYRPEVLRDAVVEALESRTAEQLVERVRRRWWAHGYAVDVMPGERGIGSPVGVAVALVRPSADCPDPMCEDGTTVHTGAPCRACAERRAARKGGGGGVPAPRSGQAEGGRERWECAECRAPRKGPRPADGLCSGCRAEAAEAADAARRLREELVQAEAERARRAAEDWGAVVEAAYAEHAVRERRAAELRALEEQAERRRLAEAAERRRLAEQIAQEYPELAALSPP